MAARGELWHGLDYQQWKRDIPLAEVVIYALPWRCGDLRVLASLDIVHNDNGGASLYSKRGALDPGPHSLSSQPAK